MFQENKPSKKDYKIFIDKNDIINIIFTIKETPSTAYNDCLSKMVLDDFLTLIKKSKKNKYNILINMKLVSNVAIIRLNTLNNITKIAASRKINKMSAVGGGVILQTVSNFVTKSIGREDKFKWFNDTKKAIEWLKK